MFKRLAVCICLALTAACGPRQVALPSAAAPLVLDTATARPGQTETYAAILTANVPPASHTPSATVAPTLTRTPKPTLTVAPTITPTLAAKATATKRPTAKPTLAPAFTATLAPPAGDTATSPPVVNTAPPPVDTVAPADTVPPPADTQPPADRHRTGAQCVDGTTSSATGSGACSHHGGVSCWFYSDGTCTKP